MSYDSVRRTAIVLIACDTLLVAAYLLDVALGHPSWTLNRLVNLDAEGTVAVWYTSAKLLLAGVLWITTAKAAARQSVAKATESVLVASATVGLPSGGFSRRKLEPEATPSSPNQLNTGSIGPTRQDVPSPVGRRFLGLVGLVFLFLSLDETAGIHELMTASLRHVDVLPRFTGNHGIWIPFLLIGLTTFLVGTLRAWLRLWRYARTGALLLCVGLAIGLLGAVGLEIMSYELIRPAGIRALYVLEVTLEEGLELMGATLLLIGSAHVFVTGSPNTRRRAGEGVEP